MLAWFSTPFLSRWQVKAKVQWLWRTRLFQGKTLVKVSRSSGIEESFCRFESISEQLERFKKKKFFDSYHLLRFSRFNKISNFGIKISNSKF
jgi:hypothetical protein